MSYISDQKLKIGIFGFTGCAGDQLVIIHDEDRLLEYFEATDIIDFVMASSNPDTQSPLDVALVEGSINTEAEVEELLAIRQRSRIVVAIGNCAIHAGVQGGFTSKNQWEEAYNNIYGNTIELTNAHRPQPITKYINVEFMVPGCPIDPDHIYEIFSQVIHGLLPDVQNRPVCDACRLNENSCLLNKGILCMGPITVAGCKAACPSNNVTCIGCYGLYEGVNLQGFISKAKELGLSKNEVIERLTCHGGKTMISKLKKLEAIN